jgi:hypothetical protein
MLIEAYVSTNQHSTLDDFKLFYEELKFRKPIIRVRRIRPGLRVSK